jgi:hypothetical protein
LGYYNNIEIEYSYRQQRDRNSIADLQNFKNCLSDSAFLSQQGLIDLSQSQLLQQQNTQTKKLNNHIEYISTVLSKESRM